MQVLSFERDPNGFVQPTALLIMRSGAERYLCNPMPEIEAAMDADAPFKAHSTKGMAPVEIIVNPKNVSAIESTEKVTS